MEKRIHTFLMFQGQAEKAINLYTSLIKESEIISLLRYTAEGPGVEGTVAHAIFTLAGQEYMAIDSYVQHDFGFTPAISLFLDCLSETEIDELFERLSQNGKVLMPLDDYGFSRKFGWLNDEFGVSWQLNLQ